MKVKYIVEVDMKDGYSPMTERRIETAVWDSCQFAGSIRNVSVKAEILKEVKNGKEVR